MFLTSARTIVSRRRFLGLSAALLGAACSPASPAATPAPAATTSAPPAAGSPSAVGAASSPSPVASAPALLASPSPSASASVGGPPELSSVQVSYDSPSSPSVFMLVAVAQKIPEKYGVTFATSYVAGVNSVAGLVSGDLQLSVGGGTSPIQGIVGGAPLKILAAFNNTNGYGIFAGPAIQQPTDLRGKTVAIAGRGSNPDLSLHAALTPYGLVVNQDVSEISVGNDPQRLQAVVAGNADAAILDQGSFGSQAEAQGLHAVLSLEEEKLPWVGASPIVATSFLQQNPNTVFAMLKGLIDGVHFFHDPANRAACLPVIAQTLQLQPDDPQVNAFYEGNQPVAGVFSPTQGTATILNALKDVDPQTYASATLEAMLDLSFLQTLQAAGFVTLDG